MKTLRGSALLLGLLFVGVLMAPLPSEAGPSLSIQGVTVNLSGPTCSGPDATAGWDSCWYIPLQPYNGWTVTDATPVTNRARLLIADKDGSGTALDQMRFTGTTLTRSGGSDTLTIIYSNYYANPNPSSPANYKWSNTSGGVVTPIGAQNVKNDQVKLSGKGCFGNQGCTLAAFAAGTNQDSGLWGGTIADNGKAKSYNFTPTESTVSTSCTNTALATTKKCTPTVEETLVFTLVGNDVLVVNDSHGSYGGSCREENASAFVPTGSPPAKCKNLDKAFDAISRDITTENVTYANSVGATPFDPCTDCYGN